MSDIQGKILTLSGRYTGSRRTACKNMNGFHQQQRGRTGWITTGGPNEKKIDYEKSRQTAEFETPGVGPVKWGRPGEYLHERKPGKALK